MSQSQELENLEKKKKTYFTKLLKPFVKLPTERFSAYSHLFGMILSIIGTILLAIRAIGDPTGMFLCFIYGFSNIFLFFSSTMTHSQRTTEDSHDIWTMLDKIAIYFLIAGTYTAVVYYYLTGAWRLGIIIAQWIFASIGSLLTILEIRTPRWITAGIYLVQGWMIIAVVNRIFSAMFWGDFLLIMIAGLSYSGGTIFYITKKPKLWPGKFGPHDLWHISVLIGATLFYFILWRAV
ncbi:MAG: hemolysin III family protein [Candidatus Lokiarchaeota archaeon]|nr:hemolysin III family protein [Candidatus Lokiarchaeota archaeon]